MDLSITLDGGIISALLVLVSAGVLVVVCLFLVWAYGLRWKMGQQAGHTLLGLGVKFGWVSLIFQVMTLANAIAISYDRIGTMDARAVIFLAQEALLFVAVIWFFRTLRGL